jgi:Tfp pilus assembly protein PilF
VCSAVANHDTPQGVITTNFDSLVESALYSFTNVRPVVVGHESLAAFARPRAKEPLIAKIHRDLLYHPLNAREETDVMATPWASVLEHIFRTHVPVVIGYGGNDGSLMNYLMKIPPCHGMFWCLFGKEEPREDIIKVVAHHCGHFVQMDGFDELMFDIMEAMDYKLIDDIFTKTAERRRRDYQEQVEAILEKKKRSNDPIDQKAASNLSEKAPTDDWWIWQLKVKGTQNNDEKDRLFQEGIKKTNHPGLIGNYALFLHEIRKEYEKAEKYYRLALNINANEAVFNGNYANFLTNIRKNHEQAERYYLKALEAKPDHANVNGNYAIFLKDVRIDFDQAERHYLKALDAQPDNVNNNGNYASFLSTVRKDYDKAEQHYLKALEADSNDAHVNGNYAIFLYTVRKDYDSAERHFLKALEAESDNTNVNTNYAVFLKDIRKDFDKAEQHYLKALEAEPENANKNGNYAVFLKDIRKDYDKAEQHYLKALEAEPDDAINNGNYAQMLLASGRKEEGTPYFEKAFENCERDDLVLELWFYRYAHYEEHRNRAHQEIEQLLSKGARSVGWNLTANIERAIADGHPDPGELRRLAAAISNEV